MDHGKLLLSAFALLLATGCAGPSLGARGPCNGVEEYGDRILGEAADYMAFNAEVNMKDRGLDLSSSEWGEMADHLDTLQGRMEAVSPPTGLAEWHQHQISTLGLGSSIMRAMATGGIFWGRFYRGFGRGRTARGRGSKRKGAGRLHLPRLRPDHC